MAVTHNAAVTLASLQISISAEEIHNLGLDRMRKQRMRSIPQDFGELIGKCSWLNQLRDGIVRHGISPLQWRSGGDKHPHDMPPYRFTPSPTFGHSSLRSKSFRIGCIGKTKMGADGSCGKRSSACLLLLQQSAF